MTSAVSALLRAMRRKRTALTGLGGMIVSVWLLGAHVMAADGLIVEPSSFGPKDTMDRLAAEVKAKGLTVFARIDHAAGAAEVSMPLRSTELLIFGNAKGGTPLMQANQQTGIDLPLKALVYQHVDAESLSYNHPTLDRRNTNTR